MRAPFLLLATAVIASATAERCAHDNFDALVAKTSCGCPKKLSKCLEAVADLTRLDQVEQCFTASGCKKESAAAGAIRFTYAYTCDQETEPEDQGELRKRADDTSATEKDTKKAGKTTAEESDAESSTADAESSSADETTQEESSTAAETTAPSKAEATTTADATTTAAAASTTDSTAATTSSAASTTASAQSQVSGTTTTSLECSVTKLVTTSVCSVSAGKTITCTPTITESATCAPGVICQTDGKGNEVCMKRDNHLTTSGVVVTIVFIVGIIGAIIAIIWTHWKSNASNRKVEAERAALLGGGGAYAATTTGKGRSVDAAPTYQQRNPSEAVIPLMTPGGSRSDEAYQHPYNNDNDYYHASGAGASNPAPGGPPPKLHPGLGALGQDYP